MIVEIVDNKEGFRGFRNWSVADLKIGKVSSDCMNNKPNRNIEL